MVESRSRWHRGANSAGPWPGRSWRAPRGSAALDRPAIAPELATTTGPGDRSLPGDRSWGVVPSRPRSAAEWERSLGHCWKNRVSDGSAMGLSLELSFRSGKGRELSSFRATSRRFWTFGADGLLPVRESYCFHRLELAIT